jgi:hypothetical protein
LGYDVSSAGRGKLGERRQGNTPRKGNGDMALAKKEDELVVLHEEL